MPSTPLTITLTIKELLELLTYHDALDNVSLVNHKWLVERIKETYKDDKDKLLEDGAVLQELTSNHYILWPAHSYIQNHKRIYENEKQLEENKQSREECKVFLQKLYSRFTVNKNFAFAIEIFNKINNINNIPLMTIHEILNLRTEDLEAMSDAELEDKLKHFFNFTRPEFAELGAEKKTKSKTEKANEKKMKKQSLEDQFKVLMDMVKQAQAAQAANNNK